MAGQDNSFQQDKRPLAHTRVLITRSPERSLSLISALEQAGAQALLLPLIDFERAADQHSLDVACDALAAGAFDWLVVSSATTVHVLGDKAAERGLALGDWLPATTRVAAIGQASRGMLESAGVSVTLVPEASQSAAGLLDAWPAGAGRVLLPQADIAAPLLAEGLTASGASVTVVTAYRTVDFPADAERRLAVDPLATDRGKPHRFTRGRAAVVCAADRGRRPGRDRRQPAARRRGRITQRRTAHQRPADPVGRLQARRDRTFDGGRGRRARPGRSCGRG